MKKEKQKEIHSKIKEKLYIEMVRRNLESLQEMDVLLEKSKNPQKVKLGK